MAHSAYARAAGLQSEVNKITVTRVAGNEVEYKRQLNVYKKDMMLTINNIRREEKQLKKSMFRYRKKMIQNRREKKQRDKAAEDRDRKAMENITNVLRIGNSAHVSSGTVKQSSPDSGIGAETDSFGEDVITSVAPDAYSDDKNVSIRVEDFDESETHNAEHSAMKSIANEQSNLGTLPSIQEDNEDVELLSESDKKECSSESSSRGKRNRLDLRDDESILSSSSIGNLKIRTLKPRKQGVSFSDLIKLQHTTNTKKLFNLVHLLADKHGVKEEEPNTKKESRNRESLRGSKDSAMSDTLLKAASVLYPMKYGYTSQTSVNEPEVTTLPPLTLSQTSTENSRSVSPDGRFRSKPQSPKLNVSTGTNSAQSDRSFEHTEKTGKHKRSRKRNSLPSLVAEVQQIQSERSRRISDFNTMKSYEMSKSTNSTPRYLAPMEKRLSSGSIYSNGSSDSVTWAESFGLLKFVHTLND